MMNSRLTICVTCGVQFGSDAEVDAVQCARTRVNTYRSRGQEWTTLDGVAGDASQRGAARGLVHGDRDVAEVRRSGSGRCWSSGVLWDCITLLDDATAAEVGSLDAIAISHPHYYSAMVEWAEAFDCPVLLHEDDREWVMRPSSRIEFWSGETYALGSSLLIRCGGHFAGGTVLLHGDDLLSRRHRAGDPGSRAGWRSCTRSRTTSRCRRSSVRAIAAALAPYSFERIYGAWWGTRRSRPTERQSCNDPRSATSTRWTENCHEMRAKG